jgi:Cu/Ag efflux pump CusA
MLSGTNANIAIKIFGPELTQLQQLGNQINNQIESISGVVDVVVDQQIKVPQIRVIPNRVTLREFNMSMEEFMHQIEVLLAGETVGLFYDGPRFFDITVRLDQTDRNSQLILSDTPIKLPNGELIPLGEVAEIKSLSTPSSISRENVERKLVVAANVAERDLESTVKDIQDALENVEMPDGYRIEYGGQFESATKASQLILVTSIAAIIGILGLLFIEFSSWRLAGIVLLNLPLALIGGVLSVYFSSGIVSIASMIGFISLFGIATRNGILLISRYEDLKQEGLPLEERLLKGALDRLNPILMTTCTTGLALVPLVLKGDVSGNEIQSPMAIVILGGLISATILNVIVMPCVVKLLEGRLPLHIHEQEVITEN